MPTLIALLLSSLVLAGSATDGSPPAGSPDIAPTGGEEGPVYVDSTDLLYLESFPVQVRLVVTGSLPTPCHEAAWEVEQASDGISVRLWSVSDPGAVCADVLEPFEVSIPLGSFDGANLPVTLNGEPVGRVQIGATPTAQPTASLVGAGWSFGMCVGYCQADLEVRGDGLTLTGTDRPEAAALFENVGALTPEGRARLDAAVAALGSAPLDAVYGCPDCADGGAAYLSLVRDGVTARHDMEFGEPPPELAELYTIATSLIDSLERCEPSELATVGDGCQPVER